MGWIEFESFWFNCPVFADLLAWRETFECLETACVVVGIDEVGEVRSELSVAVIVIALDGGPFDGPVHSLDPVSSLKRGVGGYHFLAEKLFAVPAIVKRTEFFSFGQKKALRFPSAAPQLA